MQPVFRDAGCLPEDQFWQAEGRRFLDWVFLLSTERKSLQGFTGANALGGSRRHHVTPGHAARALSNDLRLGVFKKGFCTITSKISLA